MRKLVFLFAWLLSGICSVCWGDIGEMLPNNYLIYKKIFQLYKEEKQDEAITLCTLMIENERTPKLDLLYFYHTRRIMTRNVDQERADSESIRQLIVKNKELLHEYQLMMQPCIDYAVK